VEVATVHRALETLRAAMNWGMAQTPPLFKKSPFHRFGVRMNKKLETTRDRRLSREEERRRLDTALQKMNTPEHQFVGPQQHRRAGALNVFGSATGAHQPELQTAWETLRLLAHGIEPRPTRTGAAWNREQLQRIDLRWHDLRHEGACRLLADGVDIRTELCARCRRTEQQSGRDDANPTSLPRAGLPPNHDLDVLIERRQKVHQAFDGKACQLVATKRGNLRLRDSQHLGSIHLGELALFEHLIQGVGQAQLGLTLGSVGKPKVREHISGAAGDRFFAFTASTCHSAPRNLSPRFSAFGDEIDIPLGGPDAGWRLLLKGVQDVDRLLKPNRSFR
jgi:hypothetical protein